jgi:hypothetical protein
VRFCYVYVVCFGSCLVRVVQFCVGVSCLLCVSFVVDLEYLSSYAGSILCFHVVVVLCTMFFIG